MNTKTIHSLGQWLGKGDKPIIISGPCSAETPAQMHETAELIANTGQVDVLRAGIWKPRTRPNTFEGIGAEGLKWLAEAGVSYGLKTATEVATAQHVEQALKHGIDLLWIGARTTVNPFSVQEIADSLKGVQNVPVLVKNPINPDLNLWIGALERIINAGIQTVAAIHRGFSNYDNGRFRNAPMWELPIKLKSQWPEIELICDPSHIAGKRALLHEVAQKALDLGMNGLMIESHCNPDQAWSDKEQQLTPTALSTLLADLSIKTPISSNQGFNNTLNQLRSQIDEIDEVLLANLAARNQLVREIGHYKAENEVTIFQLERWLEILDTRKQRAIEMGISPAFIEQMLEVIHQESIRIQTAVLQATEGKSSDAKI